MPTSAPLLTGIRVLDLTRTLPGPFASMLLADLGADVVKVEHPLGGDSERQGFPRGPDGQAYRFGMINRNKRSIAVDLKTSEGQRLISELVATFDVVIEGNRPGVAKRLGVDYPTLSERNPRIVYCSISGYGQDGPYADLPGHDINYMAMAGLLRYFDAGAGPRVPWLPIADIGGGALLAVTGILAALVARAISGVGEFIDLGMAEGALYWQQARAQWHLATGDDPVGNSLPVTGGLPGYGTYETRDGRWLSLGCLEPTFWASLCVLLDCPELTEARNNPSEFDEVQANLIKLIAQRDCDDWFELMQANDIPAAPVLTIEEAMTNEHFLARGCLGGDGSFERIRLPLHLTRSTAPDLHRSPRLGEHTDEVLRESGLSVEMVAQLRASGAIA